MKYCPYCGAELIDGTVSFCAECGKRITPMPQPGKDNTKSHDENESQTVDPLESDRSSDNRYEYDGYYDDIVPEDDEVIRQVLDKGLIKRILLLIAAVLVVIGISVVAIYFL